MLLTKEIEVNWNPKNKKWYQDKGYVFTLYGDLFTIKTIDLPNGSGKKVKVMCDNESCEHPYLNPMMWKDYLKGLREGKTYCLKCALTKYGTENAKKARLCKSKSFEQWCIENNKQNILDRWDYELNNRKPDEISYSSSKKYYFKCPINKHISELKNINNYVNTGVMDCIACNSFAQWGIDHLGEDFLSKYWDYEKNTIDPFKISYGSKSNIWIKCQEKSYHGSYLLKCNYFSDGVRCPYCFHRNGKVHKLDSLGCLYPEVLFIWSNKNKKSPYKYSPGSKQIIWWKCPDGIHDDFKRTINSSNQCNFRCPECQYSKGENRIGKYLLNNEINYIPQKVYDGLLGLGSKKLSYDFCLPDYNLLIEYQGEFHRHGRVADWQESYCHVGLWRK